MTREADDADRAFEEGQNSMLRSLREARRQRDTWAQRAGESERARLAAQAERDEARAENDRLRALCERVRERFAACEEASDRIHTGPGSGRAEADQDYSDSYNELRAAIEALGPGGGK